VPLHPTGDEPIDKEVAELKKIVRQEKGHGQWRKQAFNVCCLFMLIAISILRGGKASISLEKCSVGDWISVVVFIFLLGTIVYFATVTLAAEQKIKIKYGKINIVDSDLVFEGKILKMVLGLGFAGGWVAGALGLGGGTIFNPLLLQLGVPPKVSSATGLYLVMFSTMCTSLLYFVFGELLIDYAFWIGFWSSAGGVIGALSANWYMRVFGR